MVAARASGFCRPMVKMADDTIEGAMYAAVAVHELADKGFSVEH